MSEREWRHGKSVVNGIRLHHVTAGEGEPLVLIHGFPQTWWEWRHVIDRFAATRQVIAVDYRGAGDSERPAGGYDKHTMASDIRLLLDELAPGRRAAVVGHDMGSFVAFALAAHFPDAVAGLMLVDAPVPGTTAWASLLSDPRVWHVAFHGARDVAEMLVAGREREYLQQFFDLRAYHPERLTEQDRERYTAAYRAPGALRAAFEAYRALPQDARTNAALLAERRLDLPLAIAVGSWSNSATLLRDMLPEIAADPGAVQFTEIQGSGHWIPEEQPELFGDALAAFLDS
jgi:pimeloyl-ACP methyl ester carboxylesterase